jgi:hypothetical protein
MPDTKTLYDQDFVTWTEQQAEALRSAANGKTNQPLDWENLAEEIESLGKSDRRELHRQIYRIIRHLAKLQFSAANDPRGGWRASIVDGRMQVELVLADSPSLRRELERIVSTQTPKATKRAIFDLGEFDEVDRETEQAMQSVRYTADQVLEDWFPPHPTHTGDRE